MSFPRYPAYQVSDIEGGQEAPAHWSPIRLGRVVTLNPSKSEVTGVDPDSEVSFLPMEAIGERGDLDLSRTRPVSELLPSGYSYFRNGDVVFAKITPCFENGKGALIKDLSGGIGFGTTELIVLRPMRNRLIETFLDYLVRSDYFRRIGESRMYGAGGQKRVPDAYVRGYYFALPPLAEQRAIAAFLDRETAKIDALIAEQERLIGLLKEKRQAVISQAVTKGLNPDVPLKSSGVQWLGSVPQHWHLRPLKYLAEFRSGGTPDKERREFWEGTVPWASAKDLKTESLGDTEDHITAAALEAGAASLIPRGSILVVVRGMILARTFPVTRTSVELAINQDLKAVIPQPRMNPEYLAWLLRGCEHAVLSLLDEAAHGTKALRMDRWGSMLLPVPPLPEQEQIARYVQESTRVISNLIEECQQMALLLGERRSALISAAVTGQIDVRGLAEQKAA